MTGEKLRQHLLILDKSMAAVARKLSITPQSLNQILGASDIKTGLIEQLSTVYSRPISYFFDEEDVNIRTAGRDYVEKGKIEYKGKEHDHTSAISDINIAVLEERIKSLEALLAEKERLIKVLMGEK